MKPFQAIIASAALIAIGALSCVDPAPTVHYAPAENLEHIDVELIDSARHEIDFAALCSPLARHKGGHDATDNAPIVHPLLAADILWQMRLDAAPLSIGQPKSLAAHNSQPLCHQTITTHCQGKRINEF